MDIEIVKKLLKALDKLEENQKIFAKNVNPERSHMSQIAEIVVKNLINELGAQQEDFIHGRNEVCMDGQEGLKRLKSLAEEFISLIENKTDIS